MKIKLLSISLMLLTSVNLSPVYASSQQAQQAKAALSSLQPELEKMLSELDIPSMAIGMVVDGETVLAQGYGYRDINKQLKADNKTLYNLGSTTKSFTGFLTGKLVDSGTLSLDEPVKDYLPSFKLFTDELTQQVTIRDMLSHRTGVPEHWFAHANYPDLTRAEMFKRLAYLKPAHPLRTRWDYSNIMYITAGYLMEQLTGQTFDQLMQQQVLEPLAMHDSMMSVEQLQQQPNRAIPYQEQDGELAAIDYYPMVLGQPAGGLISNVDDMINWLKVNLQQGSFQNRQVISATTLNELHKPQMLINQWPIDEDNGVASYALGWINQRYQGHRVLFHGGRIEGFASVVLLLPNDNAGIVIMLNKYVSSMVAETIARYLVDKVVLKQDSDRLQRLITRAKASQQAEKQTPAEQANTNAPLLHALSAYSGSYENAGYGKIRISTQNNELMLEMNNTKTPLKHWQYDIFKGQAGADKPYHENAKLQFHTNVNGDIEALTMDLMPATGDVIRFSKVVEVDMNSAEYRASVTGKYGVDGQTFEISSNGANLVLSLSANQHFPLVASGNNTFALQGIAQVTVAFQFDGQDKAHTLLMNRGNSSRAAQRVASN